MQQPTRLISTPFAQEGEKTEIQNVTGEATNSATYKTGFPPITMQSIRSGGLPPKGKDFNGVLFDITENIAFLCKGGRYQYNSGLSTLIGGYPEGSNLLLDDNVTEVVSTVAGNQNNPNVDMTGWTFKPNRTYAEYVADASGETQQQVNYNGGAKWHSRTSGYQENERVVLANGDIVKSNINSNTADPNSDMTGWVYDTKYYTTDYASLAAFSATDGAVVTVTKDGISGDFKYSASSTATPNGGTILASNYGGRWFRLYNGAVNVKWFGVVADGITDDWSNLNAALVTLQDGSAVEFPAGTIKVSSQVQFPSKRVSYIGAGSGQTVLLYAGSNTTNDCFVFGNGTNDVNQMHLSGIQFKSSTTMTAGAGVHFKRLTRSSMRDVLFGHQDGGANNFYHGVWFDELDMVAVVDFQARAQQDGLRVNGGAGGKADLFLTNGKIAQCTVGVRIGGAFGGFFCDLVDIINNGTNVLVDQTLYNETNREIMLGSNCAIDTADTTGTATKYDGIGIDIQCTGGFVFLNNTWVATCGTAIRTGSNYTGTLKINGGLIFNCFTEYGGNGNGIEIGNTNANVIVDGTLFTNIKGVGITCTAGNTTNVVLQSPRFDENVNTTISSTIKAKITSKSSSVCTTNHITYGSTVAGYSAVIPSGVDGSPAHTFALGGDKLGGSIHAAYYGANAAGALFSLSKSRGSTLGTHSAVVAGDTLGTVFFEGSNGTSNVAASRIISLASSISGTNVAGELHLGTNDSNGNLVDAIVIESGRVVRSSLDNAHQLGTSAKRWSTVWAANGVSQTSDVRTKTEIKDSVLGLNFINQLRPVSYKFKVGSNAVVGTNEDGSTIVEPIEGKRTHWGLISQEVKQAVDAAGVDFAGWVLSDETDPDSQQALRYDQFISPLIKSVQELSAEVAALKAQLDRK